jgi:hypothetical protein
MLLNFADVLQSPVFAAKVEENLSDMAATLTEEEEVNQTEYQNEAPALLLQMCLDELASSASKEAFSIHSQSLKKFWAMLSVSKQASITS